MSTIVARQQPISLIPFIYPELARTQAYQPAPNLTVARGTLMGQVAGGTSDVDTLTLNNAPTGGTFAVTVASQQGGTYSTPAQPYNVSLAALQAALQALPNVGGGNVIVTGTPGASYVLTGAGALLNLPLGTVTTDGGVNLTGAGAPPTITAAHTTSYLAPGTIKPYVAGNTDGSQIPLGPSVYDFATDANGGCVLGGGTFGYTAPGFGIITGHQTTVPVFIRGTFRKADLVGLDANAITALSGRSFATNDGTGLLEIP